MNKPMKKYSAGTVIGTEACISCKRDVEMKLTKRNLVQGTCQHRHQDNEYFKCSAVMKYGRIDSDKLIAEWERQGGGDDEVPEHEQEGQPGPAVEPEDDRGDDGAGTVGPTGKPGGKLAPAGDDRRSRIDWWNR